MNSFERDTVHRMLTEAARFWIIATHQNTGRMPREDGVYFAYPAGPISFDWGNQPGPIDDGLPRPLRGKRVRITMSIEDYP